MDFKQLRSEKELIKMQEAARHDWRAELAEEHPYVEVCPKQDAEEMPKKDKAEKKAEKKEDIKESRKDEVGQDLATKVSKRNVANEVEDDHMGAATRQRLSLATRGVKKKRGVKEEAEHVEEERSHHPIHFHGGSESPEERSRRKEREAHLDAQYARGVKERRRTNSKQKPLRKGEVRKFNSETGKWESNKD